MCWWSTTKLCYRRAGNPAWICNSPCRTARFLPSSFITLLGFVLCESTSFTNSAWVIHSCMNLLKCFIRLILAVFSLGFYRKFVFSVLVLCVCMGCSNHLYQFKHALNLSEYNQVHGMYLFTKSVFVLFLCCFFFTLKKSSSSKSLRVFLGVVCGFVKDFTSVSVCMLGLYICLLWCNTSWYSLWEWTVKAISHIVCFDSRGV